MTAAVLRVALPAVLACTLGLPLAHADIYTWVDSSGTVNVSNLAPPDGTQVTRIIHASAPATQLRDDAARDAAQRAEAQALAARVQELEDEVARASRPMLPPIEYRPAPAPAMIQYVVVEQAPPAMQYPVNMASPAYAGCDPTWMGCGLWWAPGFYPAGIVVLGAPNFRHPHPVHGGHDFPVTPPMRIPGIVVPPLHMPGGFRNG